MKRLIGAFIIVAMATAGGRFTFISLSQLSWFNLSDVQINCPDKIDTDKVMETSGLKLDESIFHQDIESACKALIEMPGIESVKIKRKLPKLLEIDMKADKIELFARTNKLYGLTRSLKFVDAKNSKTILPVITGLTSSKKLSYRDKMMLGYALTINDKLKKLSDTLAHRLSEIHFGKYGTVALIFNPGGVRVLLHLRNHEEALYRLSTLDVKGILGNSGFFDMTAGRMIVRGRI
ncbi:MAG: FtsQ-type POTRA domain-containing protein [candidate division Zixibacteria bacterium]|nr:FtsQ-type POTRA domain-containing protein [candidate division Zixibacteria bacterium]